MSVMPVKSRGFAVGYTRFAHRCNERFWLIVSDRRPFVRWKAIRPFGGLRSDEVLSRAIVFKRVRGIAETGDPI